MTRSRSKVTRNRGVLVMPTSVINSRVVLIVRLICHDEKVYEEIIFCKTSQYKSQLHFPSQNNRTCTKLTYKQQSTFLPRNKLNLWDFSLPLAFSFILIKLRQQKCKVTLASGLKLALVYKQILQVG